MDKLFEEIKQVDWFKIVHRKQAPLFDSITINAYNDFKKITGLDWECKNVIFSQNGNVLHSIKEIKALEELFVKQGAPTIKTFTENLYDELGKFEQISSKIGNKEFENSTSEELYENLKEFIDQALRSHNYLVSVQAVEKALTKGIIDQIQGLTDEELMMLCFPVKENSHVQEEIAFYNLLMNPNKETIVKHLEKYAWIGARCYWFDLDWKYKDIKKRIENSKEVDPKKEISKFNQAREDAKKAFKEVMSKYQIDKESKLFEYIQLAKEFAYIRLYRTDTFYHAGYKIRELYYEIVKRAGFVRSDIYYFSYKEHLQMAKNEISQVSKEEIEKRKQACSVARINNKVYVISGEDAKKIYQIQNNKDQMDNQVVQGQIAYKGNITGTVKVVMSPKDLHKVNKGDILVATMTFPNYVVALEKASAFVTDEGGILCHAAIVAREMKKPCVIGTKIATKVFKDGDIVEVNANSGVISKK